MLDPNDQKQAKAKAESTIRMAYMMADIMRKVRLDVFS
jgi:hypothetical protein